MSRSRFLHFETFRFDEITSEANNWASVDLRPGGKGPLLKERNARKNVRLPPPVLSHALTCIEKVLMSFSFYLRRLPW